MLLAIDCSPSVSRTPDEIGTCHTCISVANQHDTNHNIAGIVWIGDNIVNHILVVPFYEGVPNDSIFLIYK
jgi:hypothetical protein